MRESREFGKRTGTSKSKEPIKKFFLVCEGEQTEIIYFNSFRQFFHELEINPLIEIVPIIRSYSEKGWSNPKKILDTLIKKLDESDSGELSYETLLNRIMCYLEEEGLLAKNGISEKTMWTALNKCCKKNNIDLSDMVEDIDFTENFISEELQKNNVQDIIEDFQDIIKENDLSYEVGFDRICIIIDRDKKSFKEEQYDYVLKKCKEKDFELYVTNPCFEFWLLLHFDDIDKLDRKKLNDNCNVTGKKKYTEMELCTRLKGYKKNRYNGEELIINLDKALENEKKFCEDVEKLKDLLGCNIGLLIKKMRENNCDDR